ncbi:hypothetical protein H6P81_018225 [Aristolochia fimbriata]|uniref:Uncharacterized protein n=1 Tax=Aristolochia fimbriata TaxID=158543 RepID=A0AAV7E1X6_ARIFI|nr:hypothetical protein H6P81_018225 [Aristolochia fimbriata]
MESRRRSMRGLEENTMAILDTCGVKDSRDIHDDRLSFLEAVRSASIIATDATIPTRKMFDAIFQIFQDCASLELTVVSYQLLCDLDKHYPRVYFSQSDELVMVQEAWSPFIFSSGNTCEAVNSLSPVELIDSDRFFFLTQTITEMDPLKFGIKDIGNMFLFQYIVSVLAQDFVPRAASYRKSKNWCLLRESLLQLLLGSRKLNFKNLMKECMSIICNRVYDHAELSADLQNEKQASVNTPVDFDTAVSIAMPNLQNEVCISVQRLLTMIMELDVIKMDADKEGFTSRVDGLRTPLVELILEELMYNKDLVCPFLEVFSDPKWKLICSILASIVIWSKNIVETVTVENVLKLLSNESKARQVVKKLNADVAQLLLTLAFQAYLSLKQGVETRSTADEDVRSSSLAQICRDMFSACKNLRTNEKLEMEPFAKEALFTAAAILMTGFNALRAFSKYEKHYGEPELVTEEFYDFLSDVEETATLVDAVLCNSFPEIEAPALDLIPNAVPIGPLLSTVKNPLGHFWAEDSSCLNWLDREEERSVIYIAFGRLAVINEAQLRELASGLEQSGRPFLWVLRPNLVTGSSISEEYFLRRFGEKGKIVNWAPQQKVLAHGSVACFVSHCGWNSTTEGLSNGVPFLCWPCFADQFINRNYICDVWKIGLEVKAGEDGNITGQEFQRKVEALLGDEGIKARASKMKEVTERKLRTGGASIKNLDDLVGRIKGGEFKGSVLDFQPWKSDPQSTRMHVSEE